MPFDSTMKSVSVLLSLTVCLFRVTVAFECSDGCVIPDSYLNDDYCDCNDCGDEVSLTCDLCHGCPESCGEHTMCAVPTQTDFNCSDGCQIAGSKVDDGNCDCIDCTDESAFSCDSCVNGCPESCGASAICVPKTSSTATPNPIEKEVASGNYQCVAVTDLVPWLWIAAVALWHFSKVIWFISTYAEKSKPWMSVIKLLLLLSEVIAFVVVFALDTLRFYRKHTDGLNGWQQYTCFAEIWMFSSNAPRICALANIIVPFVKCSPKSKPGIGSLIFDMVENIFLITTMMVLPTMLLIVPGFVTHVLPMFVVYSWILVPFFCLLVAFALFTYKWFDPTPKEWVDYNAYKKYLFRKRVALVSLTVLLGSALCMFAVALAANFYRTGRYWHSLKVALYERNTMDYLRSMPLRRLVLKLATWLV